MCPSIAGSDQLHVLVLLKKKNLYPLAKKNKKTSRKQHMNQQTAQIKVNKIAIYISIVNQT